MRRIDRVHRIRGIGQATADVEPQIELLPGIRVDIHKPWKIFWPTAHMQMPRLPVPRTQSIGAFSDPIIRQRGLRETQKVQVFVTLMEQIPPSRLAQDYTTALA